MAKRRNLPSIAVPIIFGVVTVPITVALLVGWTEITSIIVDVEGPELFAAATELFFEAPRRLHRIDASLFEAMYAIYGVDPRMLVDQ